MVKTFVMQGFNLFCAKFYLEHLSASGWDRLVQNEPYRRLLKSSIYDRVRYNCSVRLPKREFLFYKLFAHLRKEKLGSEGCGFIAPGEITRDMLDSVFRIVTDAGGKERAIDDFELVAGYGFVGTLLGNMDEDYEAFLQTFSQVKSRISRRFDEAGLRDRYQIEASGSYGETRYGLSVAPDRIIFC